MAKHRMAIRCEGNTCKVVPPEVTVKPEDMIEIHAQGTGADLDFVPTLPFGIEIPSGSKLILKANNTHSGAKVEYRFNVDCDACPTADSKVETTALAITFNAKIIVDES